ncbi:hypothetical protein Pelo_5983 [Pelomyxa schiedti]|nr:hypothetical protein Pelo_5983 [Pelomyxa schiedti]
MPPIYILFLVVLLCLIALEVDARMTSLVNRQIHAPLREMKFRWQSARGATLRAARNRWQSARGTTLRLTQQRQIRSSIRQASQRRQVKTILRLSQRAPMQRLVAHRM